MTKILEDASFMLLRVNPKLSTNIKLIVDSSDKLYLESFNANEELSKKSFKGFKIDPNSSYDRDIYKFYNKGKFPKSLAYEVFQDFNDTSILTDYSKQQYEMFYNAGAETLTSELYSEDYSMLAPLWIEKNIPKYFVIFRIEGPITGKKIVSSDSENAADLKNPNNFLSNILSKSTIIKTFDLTENSNIGKYIRNYFNKTDFPKSSLNISFRKDELSTWNGISFDNGGFGYKGEFIFDEYVNKDKTIIESDYFITKGFERNGIVSANLLNLQFLFNDENANNYDIHRYFGLYVNDIEEGSFLVDGKRFYTNTFNESSQTPVPENENTIAEHQEKSYVLNNANGVLLYAKNISTVTGFPTADTVSSLESVFYIKDKDNNFYNIKNENSFSENELRLSTTKFDIKNITGFDDALVFADATLIDNTGKSKAIFTIENELAHGYSIEFNDDGISIDLTGFISVSYNSSSIIGINTRFNSEIRIGDKIKIKQYTFNVLSITDNQNLILDTVYPGDTESNIIAKTNYIGTIYGDSVSTKAPKPGKNYYKYFSPIGSNEQIAKSITAAINNINKNNRYFDASYQDNKVVIASRYSGTRFNKMSFKLLPYLNSNFITTFPNYDENYKSYFNGGSDKNQYLLRIKNSEVDRFLVDRYIKLEDNNYGKIVNVSPSLQNVEYDLNKLPFIYRDLDDYSEVIIDGGIPYFNSSRQVSIYTPYQIPFGRFSFFPVKDFDFDFYSDEYFQQGELFSEADEYLTGDYDYYGNFNPIGKGSHPDVYNFYQLGKNGFGRLQGILKNDTSKENTRNEVYSEYERLKENYLTELSTVSKSVPFINKWVYKNGKDIRNKDYRLNFSDAFGLYNFAPSKYNFLQEPDSFTHEWYLLSLIPNYFDISDVKRSWSYFDKKINDKDSTNTGFFYDLTKDNFTDYFVVDRLQSLNKTTQEYEWTSFDKQIRYSTFLNGDRNKFAESFFRGVKVIVKERTENSTVINHNLNNLSYVLNSKFNDYKFACILIPHDKKKPNFQIKILENKKWKTITMMIFFTLDYSFFDSDSIVTNGDRDFIDRTSLYSLKSKIEPNGDGNIQIPYEYSDIKMQGSINISGGIYSSVPYRIKGFKDINNVQTNFVEDIRLGQDGKYNEIHFNTNNGQKHWIISDIKKVINDNTLIAEVFKVKDDTINSNFYYSIDSYPGTLPSLADLKSAEYTIINGGYNVYEKRMRNASFANIFQKINSGDPEIIYESVDEDGVITNNEFVLELRAADEVIKPTYLDVILDDNKPVAFNLIDNIGYKLSMSDKIKLTPFYRHSGYYNPKVIDILKFEDPYIKKAVDSTEIGELMNDYELKVFNLVRDSNTKFNTNDVNFGLMKNLFYHKINQNSPGTVLELSSEDAFKSLYPLINEIGINKKDFYIFSSSWDPSYFNKYIKKDEYVDLAGTRSHFEKKSFLSSKMMKLQNLIDLETFNPEILTNLDLYDSSNKRGDLFYQDNKSSTLFRVFTSKKVTQFFNDGVTSTFKKYVNSKFGFGSESSLDDDINEYIKLNILPRFKVDNIKLFVSSSKSENQIDLSNMLVLDSAKFKNGLSISNNFSINFLKNSNLDFDLTFNKMQGFSYKFGLSLHIVKK